MMKDRTCERGNRCSEENCDPATCQNYKYNHKRFQKDRVEMMVTLTPEELAECAERLSLKIVTLGQKKDDLASMQKTMKAEIGELECGIEKCASLLQAKRERRAVEVELCFDYAAGMCVTIDRNTGEVLAERPLSKDEQQTEMDRLLAEANNANPEPEPELPPQVSEPDPEPEPVSEPEPDEDEDAGSSGTVKCGECGWVGPEDELSNGRKCPDCGSKDITEA